ncbi:ankyrin repeat protein [Colletotrichum chrysophilum]|uniref:Ankyrin repeat protein n=1 Tax=Colletotrichum chrysophilum TaxID=1836956 RepID=A0AAD9EIR2_9PEZI|nr:ankyrin repeat protein [Colletotrichum chrysophilum]
MVRSYPNLRFVLMVGIGGGVPTAKDDLKEAGENEIHLGDIVVSTPSGGHGAVIQYDFGKEHQAHGFESTGYLNIPPGAILAAVTTLQSDHDLNGTNSLASKIEELLGNKPKWRKLFGRPENTSDSLYGPEYVHVDMASTCTGCDETKIIRRGRDMEDRVPRVHYGAIASENRVMRDAKMRDLLAKEKGVLCFEMEAAGLMNSWSYLVIRGICDYADSHKSKQWQGYSALAAASYARELLHQITPQRVGGDRKVADQLSNDVQEVKRAVTHLGGLIADRRLDSWLRAIAKVDYAASHNEHLNSREEGTCQWFTESPIFQNWLRMPEKILLCQGAPGAGKSTLASVVIDLLKRRPSGRSKTTQSVAYVYYKYALRYKQEVGDVLSSILRQLLTGRQLQHNLLELLQTYLQRDGRPSKDEILTILKAILQQDQSRIYIVIDGLDKSSSGGGHTVPALDVVLALKSIGNISIMITARPSDIMEKALCEAIGEDEVLRLQITATEDDLRKYVNRHLRIWSFQETELRTKCLRKIVKASTGIFLKAILLCETFNSLETLHSVRKLWKLPTNEMDLKKVYDSALSRVRSLSGERRELVLMLLRWIVHARRRLTTSELEHALSIHFGDQELNNDRIPNIHQLLSSCAGLVQFSQRQSDKVGLIHSTAYDFLLECRDVSNLSVLADISIKCTTYLSLKAFRSGPCSDNLEFQKRKENYPFFVYASSYWGEHAEAWSVDHQRLLERQQDYEGILGQSNESLLRFLESGPGFIASFQGYDSRYSVGNNVNLVKATTPLHLAAMYGLVTVLETLLVTQIGSDMLDDHGKTPLMNASRRWHPGVVKLLLQQTGIKVNQKDNSGKTALSLAAGSFNLAGNENRALAERRGASTVKELIKSGNLDVGSRDATGRTALSFAASRGNYFIAKTLVEIGKSSIGAREKDKWTPLARAAAIGHEEILGYLLRELHASPIGRLKATRHFKVLDFAMLKATEHGKGNSVKMILSEALDEVNVNCRNHRGETPLWQAIKRNHRDIAQCLLLIGKADPTLEDKESKSPIFLAFESERKDLVRMLLGLDQPKLHIPDTLVWDALYRVSQKDSFDSLLMEVLETANLDACSQDRDGTTPLHWAARKGFIGLVRQFLCQISVKPDVACKAGRTALWHAVDRQHLRVVGLLLETGKVDVNLRAPTHAGTSSNDVNEAFRTPLELALRHGNEDIASLLAQFEGINVAGPDLLGRLPIIVAAGKGLLSTVRIMLQRDEVQVDAQNSQGQTALMLAAEKGDTAMVRLLLDSGADESVADIRKATALSISVERNRLETIKLLTSAGITHESENKRVDGAVINLPDFKGRTPLAIAVEKGNREAVHLLAGLHGVIFETQDKKGRTALHIAVEKNRVDLVSVLAPLSRAALSRQDQDAMTPFCRAVMERKMEIVIELSKVLSSWIGVNKKSPSGSSILSTATRQSLWMQIELLLRISGTDLNTRTSMDEPPYLMLPGAGKAAGSSQHFREAYNLGQSRRFCRRAGST